MNMGFFIGTADRRELEFEHGMHSCLVKQCYHQRFQSLYGGSPDGVGTTGTKRNRPVFRLPRLSRHKLGMRRYYTQKKHAGACCASSGYSGFQSRLQILLQRANFTAKTQRTSINYIEILPRDQSRRQEFLQLT